ncbi:60S ribosomal protein L27a-2 [Capsicum baccatum]|uniref:60S ribosomal protein L27a-2 n=1 Tax=Capsicum baccatum TaxID=33114 RepID=A0A2G2XQ84_CAPBA|nr:60S ribosomal protein L27a-2 [Capsicum baccatum]
MTTHFKKNKEKCSHVSAVHGCIGKHKKHLDGRGNARVLGKGVLPENRVVVVKAKLISKNDEKKIRVNGGDVVLTAVCLICNDDVSCHHGSIAL